MYMKYNRLLCIDKMCCPTLVNKAIHVEHRPHSAEAQTGEAGLWAQREGSGGSVMIKNEPMNKRTTKPELLQID